MMITPIFQTDLAWRIVDFTKDVFYYEFQDSYGDDVEKAYNEIYKLLGNKEGIESLIFNYQCLIDDNVSDNDNNTMKDFIKQLQMLL